MIHQVLIIHEAEEDVFDIYRQILLNTSANAAEQILGRIEEACESLRENPESGHFPPELERIGVSMYREIHYKPYRVIYQIEGKKVYVHCVLDGRRDLQRLLERRLLR